MGISIAWQVFNTFICLKYNADHILLTCLHDVLLSKSIKFKLFERHECTIDLLMFLYTRGYTIENYRLCGTLLFVVMCELYIL
jgi:hypothetical protein